MAPPLFGFRDFAGNLDRFLLKGALSIHSNAVKMQRPGKSVALRLMELLKTRTLWPAAGAAESRLDCRDAILIQNTDKRQASRAAFLRLSPSGALYRDR
jgi:hypothetical protein